uniref:Uncharacterized protein n=1 Tax=Arundo donax TaxID=35708 RepID=A0A0A9DSX3_ARUDO
MVINMDMCTCGNQQTRCYAKTVLTVVLFSSMYLPCFTYCHVHFFCACSKSKKNQPFALVYFFLC